jgi:hypothetical protein
MRVSLRILPIVALAAWLAACSGSNALTPGTAGGGATGPMTALTSHPPAVTWNLYVNGKGVHALYPRHAHAATKGGGSYNLVYHGGPIQKYPKIYVIYWGFTSSSADPDGVAPYLTSFLQGLSGTPYYDIMTQYYSTAAGNVTDRPHEYAGQWFDSSSVPNQPSDTQIANEAIRAAGHFGYNADASYVVQLPHGSYNNLKWCAYHSVTSSSYGPVHYTNLPYQPDFPGCGTDSVNSGARGLVDSTSETAAHEVAETQTDPDTRTGWYDAYGNEIGDYCSYIDLQNITISTGTFATQPLWSNAANYCAISYP